MALVGSNPTPATRQSKGMDLKPMPYLFVYLNIKVYPVRAKCSDDFGQDIIDKVLD